MISALIKWSLDNPLIVLALSGVLVVLGLYSFRNINVEAYPDPAPAVIEIVAQWPGASAEEMERLVTVPLEVTLAGMPQLKTVHSRSLFGLTHLRCIFHYDYAYDQARQQVINRLATMNQSLPTGVAPQISPANPIGEIYRYTLKSPKNKLGQDIYTLNDLKALQDWLIEREFRKVPRIIDVTSFGGTIKRYEIQPDPDMLKAKGITLNDLATALANSNANVGGDYLVLGRTVQMIRCRGLVGSGEDPMVKAMALKTPEAAAKYLREQEQERLDQIRAIVIKSVNNVPIRVDQVVEGGPLPYRGAPSKLGVIVSNQTRLGRVSMDKAMDKDGLAWRRDDEKVQGIVLMRKNEMSLPAIEGVKKKVEELNEPGRLLPGVILEPYYDREELVHLTTHTVVHNLVVGIALVVMILMMFLNNVRSAFIVAINIPVALLFAFAVLYLRGKSANLLSIGAVDFGIIVDSAVIMVENIYRNLASGEHADLPLKDRIWKFSKEIDRALFFSTLIMVCAFIPLFTMQGAEGELFGPMAQTYAFALGCALLMALTLTPVLCLLMFRSVKPTRENILVRAMKAVYLVQLRICLAYPKATLAGMLAMLALTAVWPLMHLGREFMPELEEGNLWIRATFPVNVSLDAVRDPARMAREIVSGERYKITDDTLKTLRDAKVREDLVVQLAPLKDREETRTTLRNRLMEALPGDVSRHGLAGVPVVIGLGAEALLREDPRQRVANLVFKHTRYNVYPEIQAVIVQSGRPDDGTDPGGFNNVEIFVPLKAERDWPYVRRPNGRTMIRTHHDITHDMRAELARKLPGIEWGFSQYIHDNVMEAISGVKGDNCVKIYGPDLDRLENLAEKTKNELANIKGLYGVGVFHIMGQSNLEFVVDKDKCKRWGVQVADVNNVINTAVHGAAQTQMIEGEKTFDITLRYPFVKRQDESSILDLPVDIGNNTMTPGSLPSAGQTVFTGPATGVSPSGRSDPAPAQGSINVPPYSTFVPRLRLRDLVSPVDAHGNPNPGGSFTRPGGSMIMRELGKRFIAVKYSIRDDWDLASAVTEVKKKTKEILPAEGPYYAEFGGEFEQMEAAEQRLMLYVPVSLVLIFVLLYIAFNSALDALVVLSNVLALAAGGIWTLYLTGTNFSISAAVGFVSLFGVAIMDGLLMISYFNDLRRQGLPVREATIQGALLRVRPVTMTALTAILGLLPAALSTAIGSQTQRPLAFVVVGGMTATLFLTHYLMPLLYSFYGHREPPEASSMSH